MLSKGGTHRERHATVLLISTSPFLFPFKVHMATEEVCSMAFCSCPVLGYTIFRAEMVPSVPLSQFALDYLSFSIGDPVSLKPLFWINQDSCHPRSHLFLIVSYHLSMLIGIA